MLRFLTIGKTLMRYWRMSQDPKTPNLVKGLVYTGMGLILVPPKLRPKFLRGQSVLEEEAIAPGLITLAMLMIPKEVHEKHTSKEENQIERKKTEGAHQAVKAERKEAVQQEEASRKAYPS